MERYLPPSVLAQLLWMDSCSTTTAPAPTRPSTALSAAQLQTVLSAALRSQGRPPALVQPVARAAPPYGGMTSAMLPLQARVKALQLAQQLLQHHVTVNRNTHVTPAPPRSRVLLEVPRVPLVVSCYPERHRRSSTGSSTVSSPPQSPDQIDMASKTPPAVSAGRGRKRHRDESTSSPSTKRARSDHESRPSPSSAQPSRNKNNQMSEFIWQHHLDTRQSKKRYSQKMQLRNCLFTIMKGVFPYCGLYVVGSSMSGYGTESSDMDLCLMLSQEAIDQRREAMQILTVIHAALRKCSYVKNSTVIKAKVPILKFDDVVSGVECDLNINNAVGIRNTHLLNSYSKWDWRVAPLVMFVKHWAKVNNINDARIGTISSYSLVLMVIHYLQCGCSPAILPSLQQMYPEKFHTDLDVRLLSLNEKLEPSKPSENNQSLGDLFCGFLNYYVNEFDFARHAVSVRLGRRIPGHIVAQNCRDTAQQWKFIRIEEPFDLSNTARSVYDSFVFSGIQRVFKQSYWRLKNSGDVQSILSLAS